MPKPFLEALDERVLVCDGAMGTMLYAKGVFINKSFDALNLTRPELVGDAERTELDPVGAERIRLDDVSAGADVLLMDVGHQLGPRDVERIEALIDEDALRVQHRAHRAVADQYPIIKSVKEGLQRHLVNW